MASHDELTGLPARTDLLGAIERLDAEYSVAMVDVDDFKTFNELHGPDVGDQVLRMVAARLGRVSGGGRAFRYGGEEFAILFPGKSVEEVVPDLEQVRQAVADANFTLRGRGRPQQWPVSGGGGRAGRPIDAQDLPPYERLSVTVSIGVAAPPDASCEPERVLKAADQALREAKRGGRNRVHADS